MPYPHDAWVVYPLPLTPPVCGGMAPRTPQTARPIGLTPTFPYYPLHREILSRLHVDSKDLRTKETCSPHPCLLTTFPGGEGLESSGGDRALLLPEVLTIQCTGKSFLGGTLIVRTSEREKRAVPTAAF